LLEGTRPAGVEVEVEVEVEKVEVREIESDPDPDNADRGDERDLIEAVEL
jgi:hypothetical protein